MSLRHFYQLKKYIHLIKMTFRDLHSDGMNFFLIFILQSDYDMVDYLNELREHCLEAFTGIIQGLKGEDDKNINRMFVYIIFFLL